MIIEAPILTKSVVIGEKIYVSFKWTDNELFDSFNMFYDQGIFLYKYVINYYSYKNKIGLSEIALTQSNTINIKINANQDLHQVMSNLQEKERLLSALFK